jgi:hypothetical protein
MVGALVGDKTNQQLSRCFTSAALNHAFASSAWKVADLLLRRSIII